MDAIARADAELSTAEKQVKNRTDSLMWLRGSVVMLMQREVRL